DGEHAVFARTQPHSAVAAVQDLLARIRCAPRLLSAIVGVGPSGRGILLNLGDVTTLWKPGEEVLPELVDRATGDANRSPDADSAQGHRLTGLVHYAYRQVGAANQPHFSARASCLERPRYEAALLGAQLRLPLRHGDLKLPAVVGSANLAQTEENARA